jgi:hypothetical protein
MSVQSWRQKVNIRCHPIRSAKEKREMMQKANVSHGTAKMVEMERRRELPCVRRVRTLYSEQFVDGAVLISMERKKW